MGRHVAVRKASATVAGARGGMALGRAGGMALGAMTGPLAPIASPVLGAIGGAAVGAAGSAGGAAVDAAKLGATGAKNLATGAKNVAVAGKNAAQTKIGEIGAKEVGTAAAGMAQNQANAQAAQSQQTMQNNIQGAKDTAQQAKDEAGIAKAWNLVGFKGPEYADFKDKLIADAKKVSKVPSDYWKKKMGHGDTDLARYIPNQVFMDRGKRHDVTPFQLSYAMMQHLHENNLIERGKNHDSVVLDNFLHTDERHPSPHLVDKGDEHMLSPVMDINTFEGITAHPRSNFTPQGKRAQRISAVQIVKPNDMTLPLQSVGVKKPSTQLRNRKIITDEANRLHFSNFMTEPMNYKNMQARGLSPHITQNEAAQRVAVSSPYVQGGVDTNPLLPMSNEGKLRRQVLNAPVNVRARQKQQEAEEAAQKQAEEDALAQQPITITPFGVPGMYNVKDPAVGPQAKMMSHMEAVAAGYEQYLPVQTSQPMDLAWQMLFKAGVEVHHDEPLPQEFTQDIATLDRQHKMVPTENGTMIDNISPHMLRTIELMAQNHKDDDTFTPKPFEMPTTFH
tara:strand:+ start:2155 stop:3843 length:1689 start_codon:yes stop_codon:yes gene_type:complete